MFQPIGAMVHVLANPDLASVFAGVLGLSREQLDQMARRVSKDHRRCAA